jgi:hypothetical protein
MYTVSLAFRFVAMTLMLAHANWFCEKMDIPLERPITSENIKWAAPVFPGGFVGGAFTYRRAIIDSVSSKVIWLIFGSLVLCPITTRKSPFSKRE